MARINAQRNPRGQAYHMLDDEDYVFGDGFDAGIGWDTYQTNDAMSLWVSGSNTLIFGTKDNLYTNNRDLAFPAQADPTFVWTSSASWAVTTNEWFAIQYNTAGSYGSLDVGIGHIRLQDEVVCTTHVYQGDLDRFYQGDGNDFFFYFDAVGEQYAFAGLGTADADGGGIVYTLQDGGTGGTGNHTGGPWLVTCGAGQGTGLDGHATFRTLYLDIYDQPSTPNLNLRLDCAYTSALTATISTGSAFTSGFELATAAGGIVIDSAAAVTVEATTTFRVDGTTHSFYPAAGTANQFLAIDVDTVDTEAAINLGSALTAGLALQFAGAPALKINNAVPTAFLAAAGAGQSTYFRAQSAATGSGLAGGSIDFTPGAGDGAGKNGQVKIVQPGGAAGNELVLEHFGAGSISTANGSTLYLQYDAGGSVVNCGAFLPYAFNAYGLGSATLEWLSAHLGEGASSGLYLGLGQEHRIYAQGSYLSFESSQYIAFGVVASIDSTDFTIANTKGLRAANADGNYFTIKARDTGVGLVEVARVAGAADPYFSMGGSQQFKFYNSGYGSVADDMKLVFGTTEDWGIAYDETTTDSLILYEGTAAAGIGALAIKGSAITGFAAAANTAGNDLYIATQTAGTNGGANPRGGNLDIALGLGTGTGLQGIASFNGPVSITPATAAAGLFINQDYNHIGINVDCEAAGFQAIRVTAKNCIYITQDITDGYGLAVDRNIAEVGTAPLVQFVNDHASNTQPTLLVHQDGAGYGISMLQNPAAAAIYIAESGLATTPADGIVIANTTAALVGVQVQMSPRLRLRGTAWNGADSDTSDWAIDVLPAAATPITSTLRFGHSLESAAYTYPMLLTNAGYTTIAGGVTVGTTSLAYATVASNRTYTGPGSQNVNCFLAQDTVTLGIADSFEGLFVSPAVTEATSGTHPTIAGIYINNFTVTDGGGSEVVTNLAALYIAGAPVAGTTPTNGPYAIFVDAGASRFDGTIAANDIITLANEKALNTGVAASDYYTLGAVDNDTSLIVECARLVGDAQPRFYASRFQLSYDTGDYQTSDPFDNYTPPTDVWEGRVHLAYDTDGGAGRIYIYINSGWHYCTMDV